MRTPDLEGQQFFVPWSRESNAIRIKVPWFGSACLLWLAFQEQRAKPMPSPPQSSTVQAEPASRAMIAYFSLEGFIPTGSLIGVDGGLTTTAPLPPIPIRKVWLNGHKVGRLNSRNYRGWHPLITISLPNDILNYLKQENELVIEPDGPQDFFKLRNLHMTIMLSDGRVIRSDLVSETYSSCQHPLAEGITGSPIRIKFRVPIVTSQE